MNNNTNSENPPKYYNVNTEFEDNVKIKNSNVELLKDDNVSIINIKDIPKEIVITTNIDTGIIDYTDNQYKREVAIIYGNYADKNRRRILDSHLSMYKQQKDDFYKIRNDYRKDNILYPIVDYSKKFYIKEADNKGNREIYKAEKIGEPRPFIFNDIYEHISQYNNISKAKNMYLYNIENQLYNHHRFYIPKEYPYIKDVKRNNYIANKDRDVIRFCVMRGENDELVKTLDLNKDVYLLDLYKKDCIGINNENINIETSRIFSRKEYNTKAKENIVQIYEGDNVSLMGYISRLPNKDEEIFYFNIETYLYDISRMKKGDNVKVCINEKSEFKDSIFKGKISFVDREKIDIKLNEKITINNIKTDIIVYDKTNYNKSSLTAHIYPIEYLDDELYRKNMLYKSKEKLFKPIIFILPNDDKYNISYYFDLILPNIKELIICNDKIINFNDILELMEKYELETDLIINEDIEFIYNHLKISIDKIAKKDKDTKEILENKKKEKDDILYTFLNKTVKELTDEYNLLKKDIKELDKERKLFISEKQKLDIEIEKTDKLEGCDNIKIEKMYYSNEQLMNDEKDSKLNNKYVIQTSNNYSILYKMEKNKWIKKHILGKSFMKNIKPCNGYFYLDSKLLKKKTCIYESVGELCTNKDYLILKRKIEVLESQTELTNSLLLFVEKFNKCEKYYKKLNENLKWQNSYDEKNTLKIRQQTFQNKDIDISLLEGDQDFENYEENNNASEFDGSFSGDLGTRIEGESMGEDLSFKLNSFEISQSIKFTDIPKSIKKNFKLNENYFNIVAKLLNQMGINVDVLTRIMITKEVVDFHDKILEKFIIEPIKKRNEKYSKMKTKKIISEILEKTQEGRKSLNINLHYIVSAIILIYLQIMPNPEINIKIVNLDKKCKDYFSLYGFPMIEKKEKKQLIMYISCVLFENNKHIFKKNENLRGILENILGVVNYLLKNKSQFQIILNKRKKEAELKNKISSTFNTNIWSGFKPELIIKDEPKTSLGKYLYQINKILNRETDDTNPKIKDVFGKPLVENLCCYEILDENYSYYNYYKKNSLDINNILNNIKKDKEHTSKLGIYETYISIMKNHIVKTNENDLIFYEKGKKFLFPSGVKQYKKSFKNNYKHLYKLFTETYKLQDKNKALNYESLECLVKDNKGEIKFEEDKYWIKVVEKIDNMLNKLFDILKKNTAHISNEDYPIKLQDDDKENLKLIFVKLDKFIKKYTIKKNINTLEDKIITLMDILKNEFQQFIKYKIGTIVGRLLTGEIKDRLKRKYLNADLEENIVNNIYKDDVMMKYISDINLIATSFIPKLSKNQKDNIIEVIRKDVDNLSSTNKDDKKIVYILGYTFLIIMFNLYVALLGIDVKDKTLTPDSIIEEIELLSRVPENITKVQITSNIISHILVEFNKAINIHLLDGQKLIETKNALREEKNKQKMQLYEGLSLDENKLLKTLADTLDINNVGNLGFDIGGDIDPEMRTDGIVPENIENYDTEYINATTEYRDWEGEDGGFNIED
jgi:hypothetical protein